MENDNGKIMVSREVFEGISAVRGSGLTNMLDRPRVASLCYEMGYEDAGEWIEQNKKEYAKAIFCGLALEDPGTGEGADAAEANPEAEYAEQRAAENAQAEAQWLGNRIHGAWCHEDCECQRTGDPDDYAPVGVQSEDHDPSPIEPLAPEITSPPEVAPELHAGDLGVAKVFGSYSPVLCRVLGVLPNGKGYRLRVVDRANDVYTFGLMLVVDADKVVRAA
jgi:hypothetical protein